jgi:hypothetical protein
MTERLRQVNKEREWLLVRCDGKVKFTSTFFRAQPVDRALRRDMFVVRLRRH